jgi:hypothetical protein
MRCTHRPLRYERPIFGSLKWVVSSQAPACRPLRFSRRILSPPHRRLWRSTAACCGNESVSFRNRGWKRCWLESTLCWVDRYERGSGGEKARSCLDFSPQPLTRMGRRLTADGPWPITGSRPLRVRAPLLNAPTPLLDLLRAPMQRCGASRQRASLRLQARGTHRRCDSRTPADVRPAKANLGTLCGRVTDCPCTAVRRRGNARSRQCNARSRQCNVSWPLLQHSPSPLQASPMSRQGLWSCPS